MLAARTAREAFFVAENFSMDESKDDHSGASTLVWPAAFADFQSALRALAEAIPASVWRLEAAPAQADAKAFDLTSGA